ncbi:MAG: BMP family ABC transporter substrate-binding protein, partial [Cyanobacteria bacterium REEB65]|nr:BMP family ABC transporter substrate-binding protein [Cyanobacteria bacterium REEB65]
SSALKNVDLAVYRVIAQTKAGHFEAGNTKLNLKDGGVGLAPFYGLSTDVSPADQKELDTLERKLADGEISIPLAPGDRN